MKTLDQNAHRTPRTDGSLSASVATPGVATSHKTAAGVSHHAPGQTPTKSQDHTAHSNPGGVAATADELEGFYADNALPPPATTPAPPAYEQTPDQVLEQWAAAIERHITPLFERLRKVGNGDDERGRLEYFAAAFMRSGDGPSEAVEQACRSVDLIDAALRRRAEQRELERKDAEMRANAQPREWANVDAGG